MPLRFQCLDDFLPDPYAYRSEATGRTFYDVKGPDGELYKNIDVRPSHEMNALLSKRLEKNVKCGYSMVRRNFAGEMPNNSIHSDNGYDAFAGVLYLNLPDQCRGGTAFWRHRKYGFEEFPELGVVKKSGKSPNRVYTQLHKDYNDASAWEQTHLAEMKFNRMVVYPTKNFHSRWPWAAWGTHSHDCRMIWVGFFSIV